MPKKRNNIIILIVILIILILLWMISKFGQIGSIDTMTNTVDIIKITENNYDIDKLEDLNIFKNPDFLNQKIIAPMSSSSYHFVVKNTFNEKLIYSIKTEEINKLGVNMKYRLKLNNVYVIGNETTYVNIQNLNLNNVILFENSSDIYTLEWKWENSDNDTKIGESEYGDYKLKLNIQAEILDINN